MVKVKIPATSANLGAGFDCLGLAVNLYNYVELELSDRVSITSDETVPLGKTNLVYSSAEHLFELAGKKLTGLNIIQQNNIPMTRGLGSSSACIIGGIVGANHLLGDIFSKDDLVNIATQIEGHPDNTTPSLLGGIVTAAAHNDKVYWAKHEVFGDLKMMAIIPDFKLSTVIARGCLPTEVSHMDARFNLSRSALLFASLLQGKYENLRVAVEDRLHQPYRMGLIARGDDVFAAAYEHGAYGVYISGAGPTIMAMVSGSDDCFEGKMRGFLDANNLSAWQIKELFIDNIGTVIEKE